MHVNTYVYIVHVKIHKQCGRVGKFSNKLNAKERKEKEKSRTYYSFLFGLRARQS